MNNYYQYSNSTSNSNNTNTSNSNSTASRPTTSGAAMPGTAGPGVGPGVAVLRGRGPPNVKVKRKCIEIVCEPCVIFLVTTIMVTALATALLSIALTSRYWEMMVYDQEKLRRLLAEHNRTHLSVSWLFDGRVPRVSGTTGGFSNPNPGPSHSRGGGGGSGNPSDGDEETALGPLSGSPTLAPFIANHNSNNNNNNNNFNVMSQPKQPLHQQSSIFTSGAVHLNSMKESPDNSGNGNGRGGSGVKWKSETQNQNDDIYAFSTNPETADGNGNSSPNNNLVFLLPLHSGVWISCIDLTEQEFEELKTQGYDNDVHCVDHLDPDLPRPTEARASWQHRMQNLAIACAMVCLILLGAAIVVGLFGILRRQISAVLVTGVIYVLAALFALFTLTIVHLKHKNRHDCDPLDVWTRLTPDYKDFRSARIISHGWSLQLGWAGSFVCVLASVMWILLSKIMRYNPISLLP